MNCAMERRTFLLGGAAALQAFGANETVNPMAIVGVGSRGTEHVKQYLEAPESARIAALCDVDTAQMERVSQIVYDQTQKRPKNYQDLRKLYEDKDIDAGVHCDAQSHWHALATVQAGPPEAGEGCLLREAGLLQASSKGPADGEGGAQEQPHRADRHAGPERRAQTQSHRAGAGRSDRKSVHGARSLFQEPVPSIGKTPPARPGHSRLNWDISSWDRRADASLHQESGFIITGTGSGIPENGDIGNQEHS